MNTELARAWELFAAGDPQGAMRTLRIAADALPSAEVAPLVEKLARGAGFDDLTEASAALAAHPEDATRLYEFGYSCVERGVPHLAVPALRASLALRPGRQTLLELAVALEDGERHADAVDLLQEHESRTADWPDRYLLVHNALMNGRLDLARQVFGTLTAPDENWAPAADRIRRILARATDAAPVDRTDLRGWHFTLTGGLLTTLSPFGFQQGMTGRWAFLQDSFDSCRYGLERLRAVLTAAGRRPTSVGLLPDRGSRALGLAAARLLGLPAVPYRPGTPDALVVAYDLNACDQELVGRLRDRAPGEVLYEHATCWTAPPVVPADVSTLLVQTVIAPWEPGLPSAGDPMPADDRSPEDLAEAIRTASVEPDPGDGGTPADPDELLTSFAARVRGSWLTGPRDRVRSAGPVPSSRFA
ncbi:hypothetical protein ACIGXM_13645 [Kitasatospora sp. NPDC052896]|uniref:hypothetical protein n=1 Tax=Kitasatospora sp. NPDC052896 TaxID=3364061 RepID=UPI0037CC07C6